MLHIGVWLLLLQSVQAIPAPNIPDPPGVYYLQDDGGWVRLTKAPMAKTSTKGLALFVETGGYTNLETDVVCPGARALTRLSGPRPTFYVRGVGSSNDAMLIQFTQKKESRTFHKSSAAATVENKIGVKKEAIRKTAITSFPDGTFSLMPEADLKPGEYLLIIGDADTSFEFGIDRKR
jgi:hypothetical protein